jgi:hypothetical protein
MTIKVVVHLSTKPSGSFFVDWDHIFRSPESFADALDSGLLLIERWEVEGNDLDREWDFKEVLNKLYRRKSTTQWSPKDMGKLRVIMKRKDAMQELREIEEFYTSGYQYRRRDIYTLLNNWTGELDRARNRSRIGSGVSGGSTPIRPSPTDIEATQNLRNR